jgi:hypothetical protein
MNKFALEDIIEIKGQIKSKANHRWYLSIR